MQDQNQNTQMNGQNGMAFGGTLGDFGGGNGMNGVGVAGGAGVNVGDVAGATVGDVAGMNGATVNGAMGANAGNGAAGVSDAANNAASEARGNDVVNAAIDDAEAAERRKEYAKQIVGKLNNAENILVALSKNPSVDEISAAIGLTLYLDGNQRHVTAIYSGKTPAALAFLRPESTFESNTASLQDFVIALNKEKADHLRYKLDGDFVKVYITPYKTEITENDLTFSQGDFNVDLVMAINVRSAEDLDEALVEYGRIMHDASIVDITRGEPGRLGEIEWSDPTASSVCEMVTELIFAVQGADAELEPDVATALLTGIVAATERFSNQRTTPETLELASKLMTMGADQQLISANVVNNVIEKQAAKPAGKTSLEIEHTAPVVAGAASAPVAGSTGNSTTAVERPVAVNPGASTATSLAATVSPAAAATVKPAAAAVMNPAAKIAQDMAEPEATVPVASAAPGMPVEGNEAKAMNAAETMAIPTAPVVTPVATGVGTVPEVSAATPVAPVVEEPKDYAQMLEQALAEPTPMTGPMMMAGNEAQVQGVGVANGEVNGMMNGGMPGEAAGKSGADLPGELVEKPEAVLPPPPAPPVGGPEGMPPSLPPVQM